MYAFLSADLKASYKISLPEQFYWGILAADRKSGPVSGLSYHDPVKSGLWYILPEIRSGSAAGSCYFRSGPVRQQKTDPVGS